MMTSRRSFSDSTFSITGVKGGGKFICQSCGTPTIGCARALPAKPSAAITAIPNMPKTRLPLMQSSLQQAALSGGFRPAKSPAFQSG